MFLRFLVFTIIGNGTLLMRLVGDGKVAQYTGWMPQVAAATASGSVESLYAGFGDQG